MEDLHKYTTFRIGGAAEFFRVVRNRSDLPKIIKQLRGDVSKIKILGGGSNILVSDDKISDPVLKMEIKGIEKTSDLSQGTALIQAGAGEDWDNFVSWTIDQGFDGLENLSAIPGTVGAAPIQNIGAYGAEASQFIHSVEVCRVNDDKVVEFITLNNDECRFGYRDSRFKHKAGKNDIVVSVTFQLSQNQKLNADYPDIKRWLEKNQIEIGKISPQVIRQAVIEIRANKLPDVRLVGTAGSFFKNPIISSELFAELKSKYPQLPGFKTQSGGQSMIKVSLAWILDNICNAKDIHVGDIWVHDRQPLVLVNKGAGTAKDVLALADKLMQLVDAATGIKIEPEVVYWQ